LNSVAGLLGGLSLEENGLEALSLKKKLRPGGSNVLRDGGAIRDVLSPVAPKNGRKIGLPEKNWYKRGKPQEAPREAEGAPQRKQNHGKIIRWGELTASVGRSRPQEGVSMVTRKKTYRKKKSTGILRDGGKLVITCACKGNANMENSHRVAGWGGFETRRGNQQSLKSRGGEKRGRRRQIV